ncbi:MAG: baseplate J/gp47 family protein [Ruminococcus sp.]
MKTYEGIYESMKQAYETERGDEVDEASDIAIRLRVLAGEIYNMQTEQEWTKRQFFAATATGEYLDYIALQRGLERKPARKAKGALTFSLEEAKNFAVAIPAGTVVATDGEVPVRFVTTEEGEIPQATYSASIPAEAELEGYRGNIASGAACIPVNVPAVVSSVRNNSAFRGGADRESDNNLRARVLESFTTAPNGMNAAYYKALALTVDGVEKAGVLERSNGSGTATVYVCGRRGQADAETVSRVSALLSEHQCVGAVVTAAQAVLQDVDLVVSVRAKSGYDAAEVRWRIENAFADYVYDIPMGERFYLSKLGKYLLDTGCIETYEFDQSMMDLPSSGASCFMVGDVTIEVLL